MERRKHGVIAAAALLTGAAAGVVPKDAAAADFYWIQTGTYCLDNYARGGNAVIYGCGDQMNQHWTWGGITSWIVSRERVYGLARCLATSSDTFGAMVGVFDCSGPQSKLWTWEGNSSGWVLYKSGTRLCVTLANGINLQLGTIGSTNCFLWTHVPKAIPGNYVSWP